MTKPPWSDGDVAALVEMWPTATPEAILARFPGRTWNSVRQVACRNGAIRPNGPPPMTVDDLPLFLKMYASESQEAIQTRFPTPSWDRMKKIASRNKVRRSFRIDLPESFLSGAVGEYLTEQREWDAGGFSPREGWRDSGLIAAAVHRDEGKVLPACRTLVSKGTAEVAEGESGWTFWRATT